MSLLWDCFCAAVDPMSSSGYDRHIARSIRVAPPSREWRVVVQHLGVGDIGSVTEISEELARCAALSKFGVSGRRAHRGDFPRGVIYEDDDFDVRPA